MEQRNWTVGESAQKTDGGPILTIVKVHDKDRIAVAWFEQKKMHHEIVSAEQLRPVQS